MDQEYFVFISYSSLDNEWAIWLRHELEHYHLPASFNGRTDVRDNLRKVFRDRDELSAGPEWDEQVRQALANTNNLIVICSPNAAKSDAVNKEVEKFIALGKEDHIFPFIVEGNDPKEYFPKSLKCAKVGGDVNKDGGRDSAFIKVVAGMLKVGFPSLWNRYEIEKAEEERKAREQRDNLLRVQSHYLAEHSFTLTQNGETHIAALLALEALPKKLNEPDRPFVRDAEAALRRACSKHECVLSGHPDSIYRMIFSSDGQSVFSSTYSGTIVWDIRTGNKKETFEGNDFYFSHDGERFLIRKTYQVVEVWNYHPRRFISRLKDLIDRWSDSEFFWYHQEMSFSNDNKYVVIAVPGFFAVSKELQSFHLKIFDTDTGEMIRKIQTEGKMVLSPVISPDNKYLVATSDNKINLWNLETGEFVRTLTGHIDRVHGLAFSPDCKLLASCTLYTEQSIKFWDVNTGELVKTLTGHNNSVHYVHFEPTGDQIITPSTDGTAKIWNVDSGKCEISFEMRNTTCSINAIFAHDGKCVATSWGDRALKIISLDFGSQYTMFGHRPHYICNGKQIITLSDPLRTNSYTVMVYDTAFGKMNRMFNVSDLGFLVTFNHKGNYAVFSTRQENETIQYNLYNTDSFTEVCVLGRGQIMRGIAFSPDDSLFVSVGEEIYIGRTDDGKIIRYLANPKHQYTTIVDDPSYFNNKRITLYGQARFSKDGKYIIYNDIDIIELWDVHAGSIVWTNQSSRVGTDGDSYLDFHSDSMRFAIKNGGDIQIWDIKNNKLLQSFNAHVDSTLSLTFSPDGQWLASIGKDQQIKLWDAENGKLMLQFDSLPFSLLDGKDFTLEKVMFSPDGRKIVCSSQNGTTIVWDFPPLQELINETHERFKDRPLTPEERKKYYLE